MAKYKAARWTSVRLLAALSALVLVPQSAGAHAVQDKPRTVRTEVTVDAAAPASPFPHFWEEMFGGGRALLELRSEYRQDLSAVHGITGFRYLRFHGIFDRGVGLVYRDKRNKVRYNFTYVDKIYDNLIKHGLSPYVELSFMPPALSSRPGFRSPYGFFYKPNVAPPKSYRAWDALIRVFARHLISRYGIDEVAKWYFEVWNEPNNEFWGGSPKQSTYFKLYRNTAVALKTVSPRLRVGGPSTGGGLWIKSFLRYANKLGVPVDFVSTHAYANESGTSLKNSVCRVVRRVSSDISHSTYPHVPLILSEYNASDTNVPGVTDSDFMGPWIANTIRECAPYNVRMMSYWTFSDVFEERGVPRIPFYGGFGLVAQDRIPKPSFNAFKILHLLGHARLAAQSKSVIVTRRANGDLVLALWDYAPPRRAAAGRAKGGRTVRDRKFVIRFANVTNGSRVDIWRVDRQHGDALPIFYRMGRPKDPTQMQIYELRRAGTEPAPEVVKLRGRRLDVDVPPRGLAVVVVHREQDGSVSR